MKFPQPVSVKDIAESINASILGDDKIMATGINEIHNASKGDIIFVDVRKYFAKSLNSAASIIILNEQTECPEGKVLLLCDDPFGAYNSIVLQHRPLIPLIVSISEKAHIHPSCIIEPGVIIGPDVTIGQNCYLQANSVITGHTIIGNHVTIESGVVIGTDAFYYKKTAAGFQKWRSAGRVIIQDHVDIGSNSAINIGVSGDTIVGEGTKIDSLVHLGHEVKIGKRCQLTSQVTIGGNTVVGDDVILYGRVGIAHNLNIGNNVTVNAQSLVTKNLQPGKSYTGNPANETRQHLRRLAALRQLPDLLKELRKK